MLVPSLLFLVVLWSLDGVAATGSEHSALSHEPAWMRLETRMDALEKDLAQLQAAHEEKFRALDSRLIAAQAALAARHEATEQLRTQVGNAMQKQLDQVGTILQHADQNVNERLQALKERLDRQEGQTTGIGISWAFLVALVGLIGVGVAVVMNLRRPR